MRAWPIISTRTRMDAQVMLVVRRLGRAVVPIVAALLPRVLPRDQASSAGPPPPTPLARIIRSVRVRVQLIGHARNNM